MRMFRSPLVLCACIAATSLLAGCASAPNPATQTAAAEDNGDPYEDTNRSIFTFNQSVDRNVILPVAQAYRDVVPQPVRQSLHDFLQNLNGPIIFAHDILQGEATLAAQTLARLTINTTIGFGGLFDVATQAGVPYHTNDLGITLARWGFIAGPYIIVPILGPSNPRDLIGQVGDGFGDPANYFAGEHHVIGAIVGRTVASGVDTRSRNIETLAELEKTALDYYATIRSLYRQRRAAQIRHERSNLPNPSPVQGDDTPGAPISYTLPR